MGSGGGLGEEIPPNDVGGLGCGSPPGEDEIQYMVLFVAKGRVRERCLFFCVKTAEYVDMGKHGDPKPHSRGQPLVLAAVSNGHVTL